MPSRLLPAVSKALPGDISWRKNWHNSVWPAFWPILHCYASASRLCLAIVWRSQTRNARDRSLITPEESRQARECLDMSQRSVAEQAGVPRTYLNQFERMRWIADEAFLLKLSDFYFRHGVFGPLEAEESSGGHPDTVVGTEANISCSEVGENSPEAEQDSNISKSESEWSPVVKAAIAIALVGGILVSTGNLPIALGLLKSLGSARQPQSPFGF